MQLISGLVSNNAAKVRMVLAEKGLDVELIEVPWTKSKAWEPKPQVLLQANPRAQVPVLKDGELTLWDSTVINEYLEERYPEPSLMPVATAERALCRLWEDEGDFNQSHVGVLIGEVFLAAPGTPLSPPAQQAINDLQAFYGRLEQQLQGREFICGAFSVADISVFLTVAFAVTLGAEVSSAMVQDWYQRMLARPAIQSEFERMMVGVAAL